MATEIEAKEVTVADLFSPAFMFGIPIYQRPLMWETDNFDQLFEDIFDALNSNEKQYFLGSILLQQREGEKSKYDLVDGQQRVTALAILMAVIRDHTGLPELSDNLSSYLYQREDRYKMIPSEMRIVPWEDLKGIFQTYVYEPGGTKKFLRDYADGLITPKDTQDPLYHLYEAITVFTDKARDKLEERKDQEGFVVYLLNQVYLVYIKTLAFASAFRLFNVLNTRGLPLNTSDLLKSENIGEIPEESARGHYAKIWRDIETSLGRDEFEDVIAFVRTMQVKEKARLSIYEEYRRLIFDQGLLKKGAEFIDYLNEIADIYSDKILEGRIAADARHQNEYRNIVTLLRRFVPFFDWIPPLLAFYHKFKADKCVLDFLVTLEKKVIIEWSAGFSLTERITSLNRVMKLIEDRSDPQAVVGELLFWQDGEQVSGRAPRTLDLSDKERMESIISERLNDDQFYSMYGGKLAKYVLLRLDMKYWELENFPGYPGTITVEHILPQTPGRDSDWARIFSDEERLEWTNRLGNLVLLSGRKNSKAQNYDFDKKKSVYFKGKSTAFRITQQLEAVSRWTPEELKARHRQLLEDATEIFLDY